MNFANPILLLGLAGVLVPVVIHLLNRRKYRPMPWAAMRFLKVSVAKNRRRMRIEDWLLLLMRCAIVAILAITLARPTIGGARGNALGGGAVNAVIVLDNSYSMSHTDGVATRMDRAKEAAVKIADSLPGGSKVALILASDVADAVVPQPSGDLNLVRQSIAHAQASDRGTKLIESIKAAIATAPNELYVVTDGQAIGLEPLKEVVQLLGANGTSVRSHVVLVGEREDRNLAIVDVRLVGGVAASGRANSVEVVVRNFGSGEATAVPVQLRVDGEETGDSATIDRIPAGEWRTVMLSARVKSDGYHWATASIPQDRLAHDDQRTFAFRAVPRVNVLLVDERSASDPRDSATFYLRHALAPVAAEDATESFVKTTVISASALEKTGLDDFDAIFLADVADIPPTAAESLSALLRRGGGVVVFPGPRTAADSYNAIAIMPAKLGAQADAQVTLSDKPSDHPIASGWSRGDALGRVHVRHRFPLTPAPAARTVLAYSDGSPAVVEQTIGTGRVILFGFSADTQWCDLALRPAVFVPLMQSVLASIASRGDESLNVRVGQAFVWHPGSELLGREATIARPGQVRAGDSQRIELGTAGAATMQYADTSATGRYEVTVTEPTARVVFAAQADPAESDLRPLSAEQLKQLATVASITDSTGTSTTLASSQASAAGGELWLFALIAVIALVGVETFAAFRFSQPK